MQKNFHEIQTKDPAKMMREMGFHLEEKTKVIAHESGEKEFYITLPHRPVDITPLWIKIFTIARHRAVLINHAPISQRIKKAREETKC